MYRNFNITESFFNATTPPKTNAPVKGLDNDNARGANLNDAHNNKVTQPPTRPTVTEAAKIISRTTSPEKIIGLGNDKASGASLDEAHDNKVTQPPRPTVTEAPEK